MKVIDPFSQKVTQGTELPRFLRALNFQGFSDPSKAIVVTIILNFSWA